MQGELLNQRSASASKTESIALIAEFLPGPEADALYAQLRDEVPWEQHRITLFGRTQPVPRLSCWIGDPGTDYVYSKTRFEPRPWTPALTTLRSRLEDRLGTPFNSVLANLYRSGADGMGWHADDEKELGERPTIASVSLGGPRRFLLREKGRRGGGVKSEHLLEHGSLLIMRGDSQARYQHCVPKTARPVPPRINLTFRQVSGAVKPAGSQTGRGEYE